MAQINPFVELFHKINQITKDSIANHARGKFQVLETEEFVEVVNQEEKWQRIFSISRDQMPLEDQFQMLQTNPQELSKSSFSSFDLTESEHNFLIDCGYTITEEKWVMYVDANETHFDYGIADGYEINEIQREETLTHDIKELVKLCFPQYYTDENRFEQFINDWGARSNNIYLVLHFEAKTIALAILTIETHGDLQVALLSFAGVHPQHQGKGLFKYLIRKRIEKALQLHVPIVIVYGLSHTSGPILQRMGFQRAQIMSTYDLAKT